MRIFAINGSPHGRESATDVLVRAFLAGAEAGGAQTGEVYLAEHRIEACTACHHCWKAGPGTCVIKDDFLAVAGGMMGAEVLVLASPLQTLSISGQLKIFIDRMTSLGGDPHAARGPEGGGTEAQRQSKPRLVGISSAGFPRPEAFEPLSHWLKGLAGLFGMELACEIFTGRGRELGASSPEFTAYLEGVGAAGRALAGAALPSPELAADLRSGLRP